MKKTAVISIIILALSISFAGCTNSKNDTSDSTSKSGNSSVVSIEISDNSIKENEGSVQNSTIENSPEQLSSESIGDISKAETSESSSVSENTEKSQVETTSTIIQESKDELPVITDSKTPSVEPEQSSIVTSRAEQSISQNSSPESDQPSSKLLISEPEASPLESSEEESSKIQHHSRSQYETEIIPVPWFLL